MVILSVHNFFFFFLFELKKEAKLLVTRVCRNEKTLKCVKSICLWLFIHYKRTNFIVRRLIGRFISDLFGSVSQQLLIWARWTFFSGVVVEFFFYRHWLVSLLPFCGILKHHLPLILADKRWSQYSFLP